MRDVGYTRKYLTVSNMPMSEFPARTNTATFRVELRVCRQRLF